MKTLAIIVNYKSAALTLQAAYSILQSQAIGPVQIVIVDNSEDKYEASVLKDNLPDEIQLIINSLNIGYGKACNQVYEQYDADLILLLNPDARLLPGSLISLQACLLKSTRIAAVGPKVYWDDNCRFFLPPSLPIWLMYYCSFLNKGGLLSIADQQIKKQWRKHSVKVWLAKKPIRVSNLSGGHVLLKRSAIQKAGGLFDPRFFLYFEDTDLFLRLKKKGYKLLIEPRSQVVHWYNQCGHKEDMAKKKFLLDSSSRLFWDKHSQNKMRYKILRKCASFFHNEPPIRPNTEYYSPFVINIPERYQTEWLFEWSPNPNFIPASGRIGDGPYLKFPEECWNMLAPGKYYGRLGSLKGFDGQEIFISWTISNS